MGSKVNRAKVIKVRRHYNDETLKCRRREDQGRQKLKGRRSQASDELRPRTEALSQRRAARRTSGTPKSDDMRRPPSG